MASRTVRTRSDPWYVRAALVGLTLGIVGVLIVSQLESFAYREAAATATVLLGVSFLLLVAINILDRRSRRDG